MTVRTLSHLGQSRSPLLIVDDFTGDIARVKAVAEGLAPFPPAYGNHYPGLRRLITPDDDAAVAYAGQLLRAVVPAINTGFDANGFDLLSASFSIVTTPPDALSPAQQVPHFDSVDQDYLAILHYISGTEGSGTAFYRERATGIERVTEANRPTLIAAAQRQRRTTGGYIGASSETFEQIGMVEALPDRLIVYHGSLLHSGMIPPDMPLSDDPRTGRLTANFFIRVRR